MAAHGSKIVVYAALVGNGLIAVTKFIAAMFTGSSSMLSESIHSAVDSGNQGLLLYGMAKSEKKADAEHPFGYGRELYFWAFIVAILIFAVGAGFSIYEGVHKILHPQEMTSVWVNYVVLSLAIVFEGVAWWIAYKAFEGNRGKLGFMEAVRRSKDPTIFTVLFEDSAAMAGLIIALVGIFLSQQLDMPMLDGVASVLIGLILTGTAIFLAYETKGLLIGESASKEMVEEIRQSINRHQEVVGINEVLTMHMGPYDILVTLSLSFNASLEARDVQETISEIEGELRESIPEIRKIFIEAQSLADHVAMLKQEEEKRAPKDETDEPDKSLA